MKIGVLPLARSTFDVAYAEDRLAAMLAHLDGTDHELTGSRTLLMEPDASRAALDALLADPPDLILVLQVTFTDAAFLMEVATRTDRPLAIWAVPEPRQGGRLRLNAFCGLNLASHALGRNERGFSWLYTDPDAPDTGAALAELLAGERQVQPRALADAAPPDGELPRELQNLRIGRIGAHPDGFDTCAYDADALRSLIGAEVEPIPLDGLFDAAKALAPEATAGMQARAADGTTGLDALDAGELDRSLRLAEALRRFGQDRRLDALAIRCWPETFTEYGAALCGPAALMGEARLPCACEADVYGAVTQLILQHVADAPVFLADLVDVDTADDSAVIWHCGQAPRDMAAPSGGVSSTVHTNRKMALLFEFALKPGPVTGVRLSQARGRTSLILARGEMLDRPPAFTGTSGTLRFDSPAGAVMADVMDSGLEHHMAFAYGDHTAALEHIAAALGLPVTYLGHRP
ncbi:L-fucose/L-arabinose isomerase family protein [Oceanomicrobium pacificus]|uniref:L-fucose isomerase C-terminal domain-containing protein n=1 Tax=Oceanomicrobium pacificus TaxID=2692916 RepID=A0A6B0U0Y2_9RHOB|nr:hypothetical protein [Oceanomicrobium pacificus]MXU64781.1 hypothetical protein [Oceanomicrobium pacificus]